MAQSTVILKDNDFNFNGEMFTVGTADVVDGGANGTSVHSVDDGAAEFCADEQTYVDSLAFDEDAIDTSLMVGDAIDAEVVGIDNITCLTDNSTSDLPNFCKDPEVRFLMSAECSVF
ncbi:hypothetical protein NDU88_005340 [Pleurodeles waltl]|uniref:Uncharacterized protein n=1 Tax=Pleurodeles waltl TaxID=8319 RepID=A0AAV7QEN2_PLEWA|nr:hypothetical protein NDU88_005340 [Pleurodeles waltl]